MKNYAIKRYEPADKPIWNAFTGQAKNATFLFNRDFMDYHSDRFSDFSLMVSEGEKLLAVLPANRSGDTVYSHQGLTYGGLVLSPAVRLETVAVIFRNLLEYLHKEGIVFLHLKPIPAIYCDVFSDETAWLAFTLQAKLVRRDCLSIIDLSQPLHYSKDRKEGVKRGHKNGLEIREEDDLSAFWNEILVPNLTQKHSVNPVHGLSEISQLKSYFPKNIRQFNVYDHGKIVAGTTIFESKHVAHSQYISGNPDKNRLGALDLLHDHLLTQVFQNKRYFDFGISNENQGKNINHGLFYWKESFGSGTAAQDFYEIETANHHLLTHVLI